MDIHTYIYAVSANPDRQIARDESTIMKSRRSCACRTSIRILAARKTRCITILRFDRGSPTRANSITKRDSYTLQCVKKTIGPLGCKL